MNKKNTYGFKKGICVDYWGSIDEYENPDLLLESLLADIYGPSNSEAFSAFFPNNQ